MESYPERSSAELVAAASTEVPHSVRSVIDRRLARLAEQVRSAGDRGGGLGAREAELQGVNWRVADLVELGDLDAARHSIAEHERLATDLRLLGYAWYVPMWRAMLALMAGRLDEAERLSQEGERIGGPARDRNAALLFAVQRLAIRHAGGRLTEADRAAIEEGARSSPAGAAWRVWAASIALGRGDVERVRGAILREVDGLASLPLDADWLYTAATLGVQVAHLGDPSAAAELYPRVLPYRHRTVTSGRATFCAGSVSLSLGLLAATLGDDRAAVAHLEDAVRRNDDLGAVPFAAAARYALAGLIADEARAAALKGEARTVAEAVAMPLPGGLLSRPDADMQNSRWPHGGFAALRDVDTSKPRNTGDAHMTVQPTIPVASLAEQLDGELITPDHAAYESARRLWNGMIDKRPALIARCAGVDDVAIAVRFAAAHELPLAVRGGGHNVAGTAVVDDGLVIDLSAMRAARLDASRRTVHVQGGATWADVDRVTQPLGLPRPAAWCRRPAWPGSR